jgi:hypothetical protein
MVERYAATHEQRRGKWPSQQGTRTDHIHPVNFGPQQSSQSAVYASQAATQPLVPEPPSPQTVRCHRPRTPPPGALEQLANSTLRRPCPFPPLLRPIYRPLPADTEGHQAIQMPNVTTRHLGVGVSVSVGDIELSSRTGRSGRYVMLGVAIYRG